MSDFSPTEPGLTNIGQKVSIRLHEGAGFRDLLGTLEAPTTVRKKDGSLHHFEPREIAAWKVVAPLHGRAGTGAPTSIRINELEKTLEESWPAHENFSRGGWRYRISSGFTYRANSIIPAGKVPYGDPELSLDDELAFAVKKYREHGLTPSFHIPLPLYSELDTELEKLGWQKIIDAQVMIADTQDIPDHSLPDGFTYVHSTEISDRWLDVQGIHDGRRIMSSFPAIYLAIEYQGELIASARVSVNQGWAILSRIFISENFRGKGLSRPFLYEMVKVAATPKVALQVDTANEAAIHLYSTSGFRVHHSYRYRSLAQ